MCRVCGISQCLQCHALPARIPNTWSGSCNGAILHSTRGVHGACAQFGASERQCTFGHRRNGVDILASTNLSLALSGFLHACALSFWKAKTDLYIIFFPYSIHLALISKFGAKLYGMSKVSMARAEHIK
jgi:hypothetical protein